jgi:hypothetical protein
MVTSDYHSIPVVLFVVNSLNDTSIYVYIYISGISRHALLLLVHCHLIIFRGYLQLDIRCGNRGGTIAISQL